MERIFQISFFASSIFVVAGFLLGSFFGADEAEVSFETDGELDLEVADLALETEVGVGEADPFSVARIIALRPSTVAAFGAVFGGVGMILLGQGASPAKATTTASLAGLVTALVLTHAIINPLRRAQNTSAVPQASLVGHEAQVTLGMGTESFGQISYGAGGNQFSAPARSSSGQAISRGARVTITRIDKGIFYVEQLEKEE